MYRALMSDRKYGELRSGGMPGEMRVLECEKHF